MRGLKMNDNYVITEDKTQTLIDYYKITFLIKFDEQNELIHQLFKTLHLNIYEWDEHWTSGRWGLIRDYDEGTQLLIDPKPGENQGKKDVDLDFFVLEMKGEGCRAFESRGGDWKELFAVTKKINFDVGELDLAADDFGIMKLVDVIKKIDKHQYTSIFRGTAKQKYKPIDPLDKEDFLSAPYLKKADQGYNKQSWSATFGADTAQVQLQLYDKFQERNFRGVEVAKDQWIRLEMRFRKAKGKEAFSKCYQALCDGDFNLLVLSLLRGLFVFKDQKINGHSQSTFDYRVRNRYDIWKPYEEFLQGVEASKVKPSDVKENPSQLFTKRLKWFDRATANTLLMMFGADPDNFFSNVQNAMIPYLEDEKFGFMQRNQINHYLASIGKPMVTLKELINLFNTNLGTNVEVPSRIDQPDTRAGAFVKLAEEDEEYKLWCKVQDKRNGSI